MAACARVRVVLLLFHLLYLLSVNGAGPPVLSPSSNPVNGFMGRNVTITVTANTSLASVSWSLGNTGLTLRNNSKYLLLQMEDEIMSSGNGDNYTIVSLTIFNLMEEDATFYMLSVTTNDSQSATLRISVMIQDPPQFIVTPGNITDIVMETVHLTCSSRGYPSPNITWYKDNSILNSTSQVITNNHITISTLKGDTVTSSTLIIEELNLLTAGRYKCMASNTLVELSQNESIEGIVTVHYSPNVTISPVGEQYTVNVSFTAALTCTVFGIPLPTIQWIKVADGSIVDGEMMEEGEDEDRITITEMDDTTLNIRNSILNFTSIIKEDESQYTCFAVNNITNVLNTPERQTINFRVQVPANISTVTMSPVYGIEGKSITLSFSITEDDPSVNTSNIQWTFTGTRSTITDITNIQNIDPHYTLINNSRSLVITQLTSAHQGLYTLYATNEAGTTSDSILLEIQSPPHLFLIPSDQTVLQNTSQVIFECLAIGNPTPDHAWYHNGNLIDINDEEREERFDIGDTGRTFGSLFIYEVMFEDQGTYTCVYNNSVANLSVSAVLNVQVSPNITDFTVPVHGIVGGNITLNCDAIGYPIPIITWYKNTTLLTSSTFTDGSNGLIMISVTSTVDDDSGLWNVSSSLHILGLTLVHTDTYYCVANNSLATVQSDISLEEQLTILYPPSVTVLPSNSVTINETDNVTFTCTIFSIPSPIIQWYFNDNTTVLNSSLEEIDIMETSNGSSNIYISILTITHTIRLLHEGNYTCTATNGVTNLINTQQSDNSLLIVQVPPTVSSVYGSVLLGVVNESVTISFNIYNDWPLVTSNNIQWMFNNTIILNNNAESSRLLFSSNLLNLTLYNLSHSDQGLYTLIASNEAGTNSTSIYLEIEAPPVIVGPPVNMSQLEGLSVTFKCTTVAEPNHTIQWYFNDSIFVPGSSNKYSVNYTEGNTYGDLIVMNIQWNDTGLYTCNVTNIHGSATAVAYLNVQVIPEFRMNPTDVTQLIGENVSLSCTVFSVPLSTIIWLKNNNDTFLPSTVTTTNSTDGLFLTSSTLMVSSLSFNDVANYSCQASNNLVSVQTTVSSIATVLAHSPVVITESPNTSIIVNETATVTFTCTANGLPDPIITWSTLSYNNISSRSDVSISTMINKSLNTPGVSRVQSMLTFNSINADTDNTQYTCTASSRPLGSDIIMVFSSFNVTVQTRPVVQFITNEGRDVIGVEFRDIVLSVNITHDLPQVMSQDVKWFFQNSSQLISDSIRYRFSSNRLSLTIVNLSLTDSGVYTVEANNIAGTGSDNVTLNVQKAPVIITPFQPLRVLGGTNTTLNCTAIAFPKHTVKWYKDGRLLTNSSKYIIMGLGTATSTLTIINLMLSDSGNYTCYAKNTHGNDSTTDQLFVQVSPSFSVFPENNTSLIAGDSITVTCNVTGYPRPTVYIMKGNTMLTEGLTTSQGQYTDGRQYSAVSILLSNLTYNDTAVYYCTGSNDLASLQNGQSTLAQFVVQYPPNVSVLPVSLTVNESDMVSFACSVFGIPQPDIIWMINDTLLELNDNDYITYTNSPHPSGIPINISSLTLSSVSKEQENNYTCLASNGVTNIINTPESGTASLIVQVPPRVIAVTSSVIGVVNGSINLTFIIERSFPVVLLENVQWMFTSANGSSVNIEMNDNTQFSFDKTSLTLLYLQHSNEGLYTLTATNPAGINSAVINLTIEAGPVIIETPIDLSVLQGETAIFNCSAISDPVHSIRWERQGAIIAQYISTQARSSTVNRLIQGEIFNSTGISITLNDDKYSLIGENDAILYGQLTIHDTVLDDATNYTCTVTNVHGTITANASLTVQVTPSFINIFPQSTFNASVNETITFDCNAQGLPQPNVTWFLNGQRLIESNRISISEDRSTHYQRTLSTLEISSLSLTDEGEYYCVATNFRFVSYMNESSRWNVSIHYPANIVNRSAVSIERSATQYAVFSCIISGLPPPLIVWNSTNSTGYITNKPGRFRISTELMRNSNSNDRGLLYFVQSTLVVLNLTVDDQQMYTCTGLHSFVVDNFIGAVSSASSQLLVRASPRVFTRTSSGDVLWNTSYTISFTVTKSQPAIIPNNVMWTFTSTINGEKKTLLSTDPRYHFSSDRYSLTIYPIRIQDRGHYELTASNEGGNSSAIISINNVLAGPLISEDNTTVTANIGDTVRFNCTVDGLPQPHVTWYLNETLLTGQSTHWSIVTRRIDPRSVNDQLNTNTSLLSVLTLSVDDTDHRSMISCQVINSVVNNPVILTYNLSVRGIPTDPCNSSPCMNGGTCYSASSGSSFRCVCTSSYTGILCTDLATVHILPTIIRPPVPVYTELYSTVNITCIVEGNPIPTITWYKDGSIIQGQRTSVYYIPQLSISDRGMYWCTATNQFSQSRSSVSSPPVLVTITNIAQYLLTVEVISDEFSIEKINQGIAGLSFYNNTVTVFSIEHYSSSNNNSNNNNRVLLVTIVTDRRGSSQLTLELRELLNRTGRTYTIKELTRFDGCTSEIVSSYTWPETSLGNNASIDCPCGNLSLGVGRPVAIRRCTGNFITGANWSQPNITQCDFNNATQQLCNITQLPSTVNQLNTLNSLTSDSTSLSSVELLITISLLENLLADIIQSSTYLPMYLDIIDRAVTQDRVMLQMSQDASNTSSRLLQLIDNIAATLPLTTTSLTFNRPSFIIATQSIQPINEITFTLTNDRQVLFNTANDNKGPVNVLIPQGAINNTLLRVRITYVVLFNGSGLFPSLLSNQRMSNVVMGTSLIDHTLSLPVMISFETPPLISQESTLNCNFFDFTLNERKGGWSTEGCTTQMGSNRTLCICDHLTHFALIETSITGPTVTEMDPPTYLIALEALSVVGVSFSLVFFVIVLVLQLFSWKLRIKPPVQLFINICFALLLLYTVYIAALYSRTNTNACIVFSTLLHYTFTVSYLAILVQTIYMFLQGVCLPLKRYYPLIVIIICWVLPLFIVTFTVAPGHQLYTSDRLCVPHGLPLYLSIILPFSVSSIASGVLLIGTGIILACISIKNLLTHEFIPTLILYLLFTIGWSAVLSKANASPSAAGILEVFFLLTGGLLGFYIFILFVLASSDVKNIWRQKILSCLNKMSKKGKYEMTTDIELTPQKKGNKEEDIMLSQNDTIDTQLSPVVHSKLIDQSAVEHKPDSDQTIDSKSPRSNNDQEIDV